MPDSPEAVVYRLAALEKRAEQRDGRVDDIDDKLDELARKADRLASEIQILSGISKAAKAQADRIVKGMDETAAREKWASEAAHAQKQRVKSIMAGAAVLMAVASAGISLTKGFAQSAWDQLTSVIREGK